MVHSTHMERSRNSRKLQTCLPQIVCVELYSSRLIWITLWRLFKTKQAKKWKTSNWENLPIKIHLGRHQEDHIQCMIADDTWTDETPGSLIREFKIKCGSSREGHLRGRIRSIYNQQATISIYTMWPLLGEIVHLWIRPDCSDVNS